jgi:hypothetical protein
MGLISGKVLGAKQLGVFKWINFNRKIGVFAWGLWQHAF